jgi:hypothetical protein
LPELSGQSGIRASLQNAIAFLLVSVIGLLYRCVHPLAAARVYGRDWQFPAAPSNIRAALNAKQLLVKLVVLAVSVAILGCLAVRLWWRPVQINLKPYAAVGLVLGERAASILRDDSRIVVIDWKPHPLEAPMLDALRSNFQKALNRDNKHLVIMATTTVGGPGTPMGGDPRWGLPSDLFLQTMEQYSSAQAVISFVGVPHLSDEQVARLQRHSHPKFLAVCSSTFRVRALFEDGLLQLAVIPHTFPNAADPQDIHDWFNRYFKIVTAQDASSLSNDEPVTNTN